jgi:hypothetical protein
MLLRARSSQANSPSPRRDGPAGPISQGRPTWTKQSSIGARSAQMTVRNSIASSVSTPQGLPPR